MRLLVRSWQEGPVDAQRQQGIAANILGKRSRARAEDTYKELFIPRFVKGSPSEAWRVTRPLEDRDLPKEVVQPVYYWITARSEPVLYEFVTEELLSRRLRGETVVRVDETASWIQIKLARYQVSWSPIVTTRVAQGMLAALRDFGLLEGTVNKRIAPAYLPLEAFVYLAYAIHQEGASGERLVHHTDWGLFLLSPPVVEQLFLEAHRSRLLSYHAAGKIIRIEFAHHTFEELADALTARAH